MSKNFEPEVSSENRGLSAGRATGGMVLRPFDALGLVELWDYVKEHGTSQAPRGYKTINGFLLGEWVSRRRKYRGKDPRIDVMLEFLPGWAWAPYERKFEEQIARYRRVAEAGKLNRHHAVSVWASKQRRLAREDRVPAERLEQLRSAGVL